MTVAELIEFLKKQPQDLMVAYCKYSEYCLLEPETIIVDELAVPRADGWIHSKWESKKNKQETQNYLVLPGN